LSTCGIDVGSKMRERERKGTGRNMNEDGCEIRSKKEIWRKGERIEIDRGRKGRVSFSWFCFLKDGTTEMIFYECF
jgi:hypothetical protein